MFRKLVIIALIMGMAGWALAVTIGNPTSGNSWSTAKYVTATASTSGGTSDRYVAITTINGSGMDVNTGTLHGVVATKSGAGLMWYMVTAGPTTTATRFDTNIHTDGPGWIVYQFDDVYTINQMKIWNYNEFAASPYLSQTKYGIKNCTIEYSANGTTWTVEGSHTLAQAPALGYDGNVPLGSYSATEYACNNNLSFGGGIQAKYIVIIIETGANGNFSDTPAEEGTYGLSEVRFIAGMNRATMPDPMIGEPNVATTRALTWVKGDDATIVKHKVYLSTDQTAVTNRTVTGQVFTSTSYTPTGLLYGGKTWYWAVDELNASDNVVTGGTGVVWNFSIPLCVRGSEPVLGEGNINGDCFVNFLDFAIVCAHWYENGTWPQ